MSGEQYFPYSADPNGLATIKVLSSQLIYASLSVAGPDYRAYQTDVVFASMQAGPYPPLTVPGIEQDKLDIPTDAPTFAVEFPAQVKVYTQSTPLVVLSNNSVVFTGTVKNAHDGLYLPYAQLNADDSVNGLENGLMYFVQAQGAAGTYSSNILSFNARGTAMTHPNPAQPQRIMEYTPYLDGHIGVVNNNMLGTDLGINVELALSGPDVVSVNDKIWVVVYLNGYKQGTNITLKPNIVPIAPYVVQSSDIGKTIRVTLARSFLIGWGANATGTPGEIEIDYYLTDSNGDNPRYAQRWFRGDLNTVGPV